jgi:hypothetical protein
MMVTALLFLEFLPLALHLRVIALQRVGGLVRFFTLMLVFAPIPLLERVIHFTALVLEVSPILVLGIPRLLKLLTLMSVRIGRTLHREPQHQGA